MANGMLNDDLDPRSQLEEGEEQIADMVDSDADQRDGEDEDDIIDKMQGSEVDEEPDFFDNLAAVLPERYLDTLASELIEKIEYDKQTRKPRDDQYEEGIKRSGLGKDAPGGADFPGASRAVHPVLIEAAVDFTARVMKELYPLNGPVRDKIVGDQTQAKLLKARRKVRHMNWQLTEQCVDFRHELEQTVTQCPMGGDAYLKIYWDTELKRPRFMMVPVDAVLLPGAASSYYSADRRTHVFDITKNEMDRAVERGEYLDVDLIPASMAPEKTKSAEANDKVEGKEDSGMNEDGVRRLFEVAIPWFSIDSKEFKDPYSKGKAAPYIITIDELSKKVIGFYRNWDVEDSQRAELQYMVDFPFVTWRGAYAIGLPQMIGGLSGAATGALRALLDSAHIQTIPTALKLADPMTGGGQTVTAQATQVSEIGSGMGVDDIRKIAMPVPFNPPSPTLYQLLGFLVDAAHSVVRTTYEELGDQNTPVGTTMARMEQAMTVFSSICARMHDSMHRVLKIVHRLNKQNLDDYVTLQETGEILAYRSDYDGPVDVIPVSDPNIFSEGQRQNQALAVVQRATGNPMYDQRAVEKLFLGAMKISDPEKFLVKQPQPEKMNPVNENVAMTFGRPVAAFPDQDHLAHIQVHLDYMMSPVLGAMPNIMPVLLQGAVEHLKQHVAFWYVSQTYDLVHKALGVEPTDVMVDDPETQKMFDQLLAVSSSRVLQQAQQQLAGLPPIIQQAVQMLQQMMPPPPMDPSAVHAKDVQRREADDRARRDIDQKRLTQQEQGAEKDRQLKIADMEMRARKDQQQQAADQQRDELTARQAEEDRNAILAVAANSDHTKQVIADQINHTKVYVNDQDNETAMKIAAAEIESGEKVAVSTGTGSNPGPNT